MSPRVSIAADAAAIAVGADAVAARLREAARARNLPLELSRTSSRGLYWLEPLIEAETAAGRIAYGPVAP